MQNTTVLEEEPPGPGPFARFFHFTAFRSSLLMRASNTATSASLSCENPTLNDYANTPKDSATENLAATNSRHRGGGDCRCPRHTSTAACSRCRHSAFSRSRVAFSRVRSRNCACSSATAAESSAGSAPLHGRARRGGGGRFL